MSKHLVGDVVALAGEGKTREEIAAVLGVTVASVSRRIRYARKKGHEFPVPARAKRTKREGGTGDGI